MALHSTDPDRQQAGGWRAEGAGEGEGLHVREAMLIHGVAYPPLALVVKCFDDWWVTTVEEWKD